MQQAVRHLLHYDEDPDDSELARPASEHATSRAVRSSWLFSRVAEEGHAGDDDRWATMHARPTIAAVCGAWHIQQSTLG